MSDSATPAPVTSFAELALPPALLEALQAVGYESPTPIQAQTLPALLAGHDLLGHAPTGTGKTAAFALPVLAHIDTTSSRVQALVLTPTRELAIQVAEAFTRYATKIPRLHVLPIYGGQDYGIQKRQLDRGVQVIVGTPGRVMDHLRRGTLSLDHLQTLVLDEADEMLRMGFIDDVEWILDKTPQGRQIALFSATMPRPIRQIAHRHLNAPAEISIEGKQSTARAIRQRYWLVSGMDKLNALTRLLEVERFDALLVFVRTRLATVELAERLEARGFAAAALNGDMPQGQREQMVNKLKAGGIDILVATDVAARGLDVDRISHVINFDIPYDTEAYIHRIGRTGRAGRTGDAILFVTPRERRLLSAIEKATASRIEALQIPSIEAVNERRVEDFQARITSVLEADGLGMLQSLVEDYIERHGADPVRVAAALASIALGERSLLMAVENRPAKRKRTDNSGRAGKDIPAVHKPAVQRASKPARAERPVNDHRAGNHRAGDHQAGDLRATHPAHKPERVDRPGDDTPASEHSRKPQHRERSERNRQSEHPTRSPGRKAQQADARKAPAKSEPRASRPASRHVGIEMEPYRVEVGAEHGVKASHLVGAIANEADLDSTFIGRVDIQDDHSIIELPVGMPKPILQDLKKAWVLNRRLAMTRVASNTRPGPSSGPQPASSNRSSTRDTRPSPAAGRTSKRSAQAGKRRPAQATGAAPRTKQAAGADRVRRGKPAGKSVVGKFRGG